MDWGGELIWAAGFTSGGTPYGLTVAEFRESNARYESGAEWARAKRLLEQALARRVGRGAAIEIGWVKYLDKGLCRKAFVADINVHPDPAELSWPYVVLLTRQDAEPSFDERARREVGLLERLSSLDLPLRIPRILALLADAGRPAVVETFIEGVPLDLRAGRQGRIVPWEIVANVAATVHAVSVDALSAEDMGWSFPGYRTRREHALAALSVLKDASEPLFRDAHAWALEHLPPAEPSVLIHGDLLGQNILLAPGKPLGLIDWEWATPGDPAYDLAIVTRGARQPFQITGGLDRLLEAYAERAPEVRKEHVHLHELCLVTKQYREALADERHPYGPRERLQHLQSLLRRAQR